MLPLARLLCTTVQCKLTVWLGGRAAQGRADVGVGGGHEQRQVAAKVNTVCIVVDSGLVAAAADGSNTPAGSSNGHSSVWVAQLSGLCRWAVLDCGLRESEENAGAGSREEDRGPGSPRCRARPPARLLYAARISLSPTVLVKAANRHTDRPDNNVKVPCLVVLACPLKVLVWRQSCLVGWAWSAAGLAEPKSSFSQFYRAFQ